MALRTLLLSAALSAVVSTSTIDTNDIDCPDGWSFSQNGNSGDYNCCFGAVHIVNDDGYCCVNDVSFSSGGGSSGSDLTESVSFSDCFPFCDGDDPTNRKRASDGSGCAEKIPFSASDYSERVSSASKSVMAKVSGTGSGDAGNSPATNTAQPTDSASGDDDETGTGSDGQVSETGDAATTTSDNAAPLPTGNYIAHIGGAAAMAAMLAI